MSEDTSVRNKRVGATIRRRRQALGWEQRELAERVGVHVNSVQKWESGTHYPGRKLGKLEQVLGIHVDDDLEPEEPELPTPEELDDLRRHALEVLGENAGPFLDALDATLSGVPLTRRARGAAGGRSSGRPRAAGSS
jgi:transcriptional regulator with XRE-family HTH domain